MYTLTLVLDVPMPAGATNDAPIERRGWCLFERRLSSLVKGNDCCLTLSLSPPKEKEVDLFTFTIKCQASRFAPMAPAAFEALLTEGVAREQAAAGTGIKFTNGKDATAICIPQYEEAFERLLGGAGMLNYDNCGWGQAEAEELAASLAEAQKRGVDGKVATLRLSGNRLTDDALAPLVGVLMAGALPSLEYLVLEKNQISDDGATALAGALLEGRLEALKELKLEGNRIGDAGAGAIARALRDGATKGAASSLEKLVIGKNAFGESATAELREACKARGVAAHRDYFDLL